VDRFFTRLTAPSALAVDVDRLISILCQAPRDDDTDDGVLDAPDLTDVRRDPHFDDATWNAAEAVLADVDRPTRLSSLLARTDMQLAPGDVVHLVALLTMRAVDPGLGRHIAAGDDSVMLAVDDGTLLEHPRFAGADVLVIPAPIRSEPAGQNTASV
jgi:hypothetical protein